MTAQASPSQALVGAVLVRRFRLSRLLGEGGMGAVYAAETLDERRPFAVKLLHREFLADANVLGRFHEEGLTCQRLVHPNILRVYESLTAEDGTPFLVMELLEGVPLSAYTTNGGRVPLHHAALIVQGMLAGLAVAHAQGIVHRDLKPDNIFLARDAGGQFVVKLLDFGIAKVMDVAGGMGAKTRTGMLLGTPAYMSPEQIKSSKDVDARSDLFSVGVLFYEMLTGRSAFPAPNEFARLTVVLSQDPEPIDRVDPSLAPLAPFLTRALQKDRALRFQSAAEMASALATATGLDGPQSRVIARPLDELPQVPAAALAATAFGPPPTPAQRGSSPPTAQIPVSPSGPPPPDPGRASVTSTPPPTSMPPTADPTTGRAPGGTLASRPIGQAVLERPPDVAVVSSSGGRFSGTSRGRGIAPWIVVLLVSGALFAGFVLGYAVAKSF